MLRWWFRPILAFHCHYCYDAAWSLMLRHVLLRRWRLSLSCMPRCRRWCHAISLLSPPHTIALPMAAFAGYDARWLVIILLFSLGFQADTTTLILIRLATFTPLRLSLLILRLAHQPQRIDIGHAATLLRWPHDVITLMPDTFLSPSLAFDATCHDNIDFHYFRPLPLASH